MKTSLWRAFAGALALSLTAGSAAAQGTWTPTKPVEFVVPYAVGGGADVFARVLTQVMAEEKLVPVPVQVVNQPGGGSAVGVAYVLANRARDPHTLVLANNPLQATPLTVAGAPGLKDLQPLYNFMLDDFIMVVKGDSPWKSAKDLVEAAKKAPPKTIKAGAGGPTGGDAMGQRAFMRATDVEFNQIIFNSGGEVLTAILGGHVDVSVSNPLEYIGHLKSGQLRAIGAFRDTRYPDMPDVPTMKEQGYDAKAVQIWRGIAVPKGIPPEAAAYWVGVMEKLQASPTVKKYLKDNLVAEAPMKGEALTKFLAEQEERFKSFVVK
jgi:putative tricarboxylic transport membrane protein